MEIKAELHCHNIYSNFHLGKDEPPYDCNISFREQLERSKELGLNALFVTNHNTLDGYAQLLRYKNDHDKFKEIQIYPAEEVTIDSGAHVLVYGIHQEIKLGKSLEEVIDEVKKQNGVTSAPHPFGLIDAIRDNAKKCDMIEVFNSNNVDVISNVKAIQFADENNMIGVAGSDSHVLSTFGRCVNVIETENNLDDILYSMKHNLISIHHTGYAKQSEILEHLKYKMNNSKDYVMEYINEKYPHSKWLFSLLIKMYNHNHDSYLWSLFYRISLLFMKRISKKINFQNLDSNFMKDRNLLTMFQMAI
jgi:hypothetical protein